ncbi:MAG: transporter [Rhodomicrobium sp.]|nr:transporter [Rhodomicrobium sp.]
MKQTLLDLMVQMMPFMMPIVYAGAAVLIAGTVAFLIWMFTGRCTYFLRLTGGLLLILGVFFLACQAAGMILGAEPGINFGDATKFEFNVKPFWMIALALLIPGLVLRLFGAMRPTQA